MTDSNADHRSVWPPGGDPTDDPIEVRCKTCEMLWIVHPDMAGFRIRCECNGWVEAPTRQETQTDVFLPILDSEATGSVARIEGPRAIDSYVEESDGVHWSNKQKARWTDGTLLQIIAILCCFYVPQILLAAFVEPNEITILIPLASLASCILVFLVSLFAPRSAFEGLNWPGWKPFAEGAVATVVFLCGAYLLMEAIKSVAPDASDPIAHMREVLGLTVTLLTISLAPGIFEELAFRGILQRRMISFFGRWQGLLLTGIAFALAHGITLGFPIHVSIGIYLCWLRYRCGSLLPGMMIHMLYNGTLVWMS